MKRISSIVVAMAAILVPAALQAAELRWDLQPGQKLRYEFKEGLQRTAKFMGMGQEEDQRKTYEWTWEVLSRDEDGTLRIAAVFDRVAVRHVEDGETSEWDSAKNIGCPTSLRGYKALLGSRFEFSLSPSGEVTDLEGIDEAVSDAIWGDFDEEDEVDHDDDDYEDEEPEDEDADDEDEDEDEDDSDDGDEDSDDDEGIVEEDYEVAVIDGLSDEGFQNGLDDALNFLPETSVEEGEVWERTLEQEDEGLDIQVHLAVKVEKFEADYEGAPASLIGIEGTVEFPIDEMSEDLPPGSELDLSEAAQRGQAWFDGANGRLLRVQNEMRVRMEVKADGGVMKGSMSARGRVTLTLK